MFCNDSSSPYATSFLMLVGALMVAPASAVVTTDGSVGAVTTLSGSMIIPQTLGRLAGNNLFHSFATFNINGGESANFTTTTPTITNVISRVTGGMPSTINGSLKLTPAAGAPGFYFINPAGITFGVGASIDVPGAFQVSTAEYLKFPDGNYYADLHKISTFSTAAPEAFGFVGNSNGIQKFFNVAISPSSDLQDSVPSIDDAAGEANTGVLRVEGSHLAVSAGNALSLVARNVIMTGEATLSAPAGQVRVGALPELGGAISMTDSAIFANSAGSAAAGNILIEGGQLGMLRSGIRLSNAHEEGSGALKIRIAGPLTMSESYLGTRTTGIGSGGDISITASDVLLEKGSTVFAYTEQKLPGGGRAGDIRVRVTGDLVVAAPLPDSDSISMIQTLTGGTGVAGAIDIEANKIILKDGGWISSATYGKMAGAGTGGRISLKAQDSVVITGVDTVTPLNQPSDLQASTFGTGAAGSIEIQAPQVLLTEGGNINSITFSTQPGAGAGGHILINADNRVLVSGVNPASMTLTDITTSSYGTGRAGSVEINAGMVEVLNGGQITSHAISWQDDAGAGGQVIIRARGDILVAGVDAATQAWSEIGAATAGPGDAGHVELSANRLRVLDGGHVVSWTADSGPNSGRSGSIVINAREVQLDSLGGPIVPVINTDTRGAGYAGSVFIEAESIEVLGGAVVSSSSHGTLSGLPAGGGGQVSLRTGTLLVSGASADGLPSRVLSATGGTGDGGIIDIEASRVEIRNGGWISTTTLNSSGNAGPIQIRASDSVTLQGEEGGNASAIMSSSYGPGAAGNIDISARQISIGHSSGIFSDSNSSLMNGGHGGTINLAASEQIHIQGGVVQALTRGGGAGGQLNITTDCLEISDVAWISSSSLGQFLGNGDSGDINIWTRNTALTAGYIFSGNLGSGLAGNINLAATGRLSLRADSSISTEAFYADGGNIRLAVGALLELENSKITTSVFSTSPGLSGSGGDININAQAMALNTGFIQANTAAPGASGGNININVPVLVASGNSLLLGGNTQYGFLSEVFGYNVIQAAAPEGVSGAINMTSPVLDVSGSLTAIGAPPLESGGLGRNVCQATEGSSLGASGWESLLPSARDPLSPAMLSPVPASSKNPTFLE